MVRFWIQVAVALQLSVAVHVLVIVYKTGQLPEAVTSEYVIVGVGPSGSKAVGLPVAGGIVLLPQVTVTLAGQVMVGPALGIMALAGRVSAAKSEFSAWA